MTKNHVVKSYLVEACCWMISNLNKVMGLLSKQLYVMIKYLGESVQWKEESEKLELRVKVIAKNTNWNRFQLFLPIQRKTKNGTIPFLSSAVGTSLRGRGNDCLQDV